MIKALIGICLSLLIGIAVLGFLIHGQMTEVASLKQQNASLTEAVSRAAERELRDRRTLAARQSEIVALQARTSLLQKDLYGALQANKEWSDTHVPDTVQKAILGDSGGPPGPSGVRPNPDEVRP